MRITLLLLALLLAGCCKKLDPTPSTEAKALGPVPLVVPFTPGAGVAFHLAVKDSATGQYFRPAMTGYVHFYPPQWTEAEVRTQAVFDSRIGWLLAPTAIWQQANIGPSYTGWYPDNTVWLSILSKANAVILWQFTEADRTKPRYSQQYQFLGVLSKETWSELVVNKKAAGL